MKKIRSKYYAFELYPESENLKFEDKIIDLVKYDFAYILHDKDEVKPHYHVVVSFPNYRWKSSVCEEFQIPENYVEEIRNLDAILMYLIHFNDKTKYQYKFDEVSGSEKLIDRLKKALKNNDLEEEDKILQLIQYIDSSCSLSYSNFIKYACSIGRFDIVRRSQYLFCKIIDEHNLHVQRMLDNK